MWTPRDFHPLCRTMWVRAAPGQASEKDAVFAVGSEPGYKRSLRSEETGVQKTLISLFLKPVLL